MSELTTMSITVTVAPPALGGLAALVVEHLPGAPAKKARQGVVNKVSGPVHGTLFQIGNIEGNINVHGDR